VVEVVLVVDVLVEVVLVVDVVDVLVEVVEVVDVVDVLGLYEPLATRLHNELFANKLWTVKEVRRNPKLLFSIFQRVLKVDVHKLMGAYMELERK